MALFFALAAMNNVTPDRVRECGLPLLMVETTAAKPVKSKKDYRKAVYSLDGANGRCHIRGRGNTTWRTREFIKKPYLLKLDEAASLLGMPAARKWVLLANEADKTQLRNAYALHLAASVFDKNIAPPKYRYVQLFLNGKYNGLYLLTEKSAFEDGRLSQFGEADETGAGGSFLAEVRARGGKQVNFALHSGARFSVRSPKVSASAGISEQSAIEGMAAYCRKTLQAAEDSICGGRIDWTLLDKASFIDWYLVNEFTKNHDACFQSSCFMVWDSGRHKLFMGPVWDFDIACGNVSSDDCENPEGLWVSSRYWFNVLMKDDTFRKAAEARWQEKKGEAASSLKWIDEEGERLKKAIELDEAVYPKIGRRRWPHPPRWRERKTYKAEAEYMTDFLRRRMEWMNHELAA